MIRETGVEVRLILCTLRHFSESQSMDTVKLVDAFRGTRVAALDIAGDEAGYPLSPHIPAFRYAADHGLFRTAHAGEALGPESVWETLEHLAPTRIGHGTRSIEDPALVAHLRDQQIHLELCPSSNVQIIPGLDDWAAHPIDHLYQAGVSLNLNTDTRMLTPVNLTAEYEAMHRVFHWGPGEFAATNQMALDAAFLDPNTKQTLQNSLRSLLAFADLA